MFIVSLCKTIENSNKIFFFFLWILIFVGFFESDKWVTWQVSRFLCFSLTLLHDTIQEMRVKVFQSIWNNGNSNKNKGKPTWQLGYLSLFCSERYEENSNKSQMRKLSIERMRLNVYLVCKQTHRYAVLCSFIWMYFRLSLSIIRLAIRHEMIELGPGGNTLCEERT